MATANYDCRRRTRHGWAFALTAVAGLATAGEPPAPKVSPGTVAERLDKSVDVGAGCVTGGDLYFEIGPHRFRLGADRWRISVRPKEMQMGADFRQACRSAPLRLVELRIVPLTELREGQRPVIALVDTKLSPSMRNLRSDFSPYQTTCQRGSHSTYCTTATTMRGLDATSSSVDLKFDLDYYRAPDGAPFFIVGNGGFATWNRVAFYRWDKALAVAYTAKYCKRQDTGQALDCDIQHYIQFDQEIRRLVQSLFDTSSIAPNAASRAGVRPPI